MTATSPVLHADILEITGADAIPFLQSQLASQLTALADGQWQASAWLDPQGRVRWLFQLARIDAQHLVILLRGGDAGAMAQALRPYVFRSKVVIQSRHAGPIGSGPAQAAFTVQADEAGELAWGFGNHSMRIGPPADEDWLRMQTGEGWPWLPETALATHVGPALSLHRLGALAIDKGCYPGQEIVARLHYRGGLKRHLVLLQALQDADAGAPLFSQGVPAGQLLAPFPVTTGQQALAVLADGAAPDGFEIRHRWAP